MKTENNNDTVTRKKPGRKAGQKNRSGSTSKPDDNRQSVQAESVPAESVRKRGRPRGSKNKSIRIDRQDITEPGDNSRMLKYSLVLSELPLIDYDNVSEVKQRIHDFFTITADYDLKPAVSSLALSFGFDRYTLFNCLNGKSNRIKNQESILTIKQAYNVINSHYEMMMNSNKINPVAGIFMMKNNLGYKDTTDYIITANQDKQISLSDVTGRAGLLDE